MSATDELHRMLDKRGVEWNSTTSPTGTIWTYWDAFNGHRVYAMDNENGTVKIFGEWDVTPEQAIEATLGRGTCHLEKVASYGYPFECSECKAWYGVNVLRGELRFCPNCGRKVVAE